MPRFHRPARPLAIAACGLAGLLLLGAGQAAAQQTGDDRYLTLRPPAPIPSRPLPPPAQPAPPPQQRTLPLPQPPANQQTPPGAQTRPVDPGLATTPRPPRQPREAAPPPRREPTSPTDTPKVANRTAVFSGLDKITGRIISFDAAVNETVQFGALQVTPRVCYTRPPSESPLTTSFVEVDEVTLQGETKRLFNGWMFASSPGLNAVEHAVYDVWLTDCKQAPPSIGPQTAPSQGPMPQAPTE